MEKEKAFESNSGGDIDADQVLLEEDIENLKSILSSFVESFSVEGLEKYEQRIKKQITIERLRKMGKEFDPDQISLGNLTVAKELKGVLETGKDSKSRDGGVSKLETAFTTDLFDKNALEQYLEKRKGVIGKKVLDQFYEAGLDDYYEYGYPYYRVDEDLKLLGRVKKTLAADYDDGKNTSGRRFERFFPAGMVLNDWLGGQGGIKIDGLLKHTLEFDDYVNYVDYYCNLNVDGVKIPVAFDATANSEEETFLVKIDRTSTDPWISSRLPFGFGQVKYCSLDSKVRSRRMPLFKITLDYDQDFRVTDFMGEVSREDVERSAEILKAIGNDRVFSREEYELVMQRMNASDREDEDAMNERRINAFANSFYNARISFFVLSEMYEQSALILEKDWENNKKEFSLRGALGKYEEANTRKLQEGIWKALCQTMRRIVKMNKAEAEYGQFDDRKLYEEFKALAGVYDRTEDGDRKEFLGLRLARAGKAKGDKCYIGAMRAVMAEREDIVYRYFERKDASMKGIIKTRAGKFKEEMRNSASPKETAREIFSKIKFDSYMDNFERLFEVAKEADSVGIFLSRLGMGDFEVEAGVYSGGYIEGEDGVKRSERGVSATGSHDVFIERLFSDDKLRKKYLLGRKNINVAAECFSDGFLEKEENLRRLVGWGVGEGKMAELIMRARGVSKLEADEVVARLMRSSES